MTCSQIVGELADCRWQSSSFNNNDEKIYTSCNRHQILGESASRSGTEKSSLADKCTRQAPPTSLPEHGADIWHHHLHLLRSTAASHSTSAMAMSASSSILAHISYFVIAASSRSTATSSTSYSSFPSEGINKSTTTATSRSLFPMTTSVSSSTSAVTTCDYSSKYSRDYSSISGYYSSMIFHHLSLIHI